MRETNGINVFAGPSSHWPKDVLHGHETSLGKGISGSPHFSEVSAFSQIKETSGRLLSASINSHLLKIILMPKQRILGWHILGPYMSNQKRCVQRQVIKPTGQSTACMKRSNGKWDRSGEFWSCSMLWKLGQRIWTFILYMMEPKTCK